MFTKTLHANTLRAIELVAQVSYIQKAYLAGGTALALQLGHRISVDLDFFTQEPIDEQLVAQELSKLPDFKEENKAWRTVLGKVDKTKFSIFFLKYPLIDKLKSFNNIKIAGKKDIAAMKIHAISDRGAKRDFIDMYFLAKEFTLEEIFEFYNQKYGNIDEKRYILIKGLGYFGDAEIEEMPDMIVPVSWEEIKDFFKTETIRLAKSMLGI